MDVSFSVKDATGAVLRAMKANGPTDKEALQTEITHG